MVNNQLVLAALLLLNIVLYAPLILAATGRRRHRIKADNLEEAFSGLELALKESVPDLPMVFTWEEAVARLQASGVKTEGMEGALKGYEEFRYGGVPLPDLDFREVLRVANTLGGLRSLRGSSSVGR